MSTAPTNPAPPAAPVIEVRGVSFGFGPDWRENPVLDDVTLAIEPRDFLGVVGPNGGGKTTLLKIMLGLLHPSRGEVRVLGGTPREHRHRIGYVPQQARVDATVPASVLDVVLMGRLHRSSWGFRFPREHVDAAMESLRLTHTADLAQRAIGSLSGGQRQRVLIARALASDAKVLLLDEPTAGVDAHMERSLTELLVALNERLPIVMVSHDIGFVSSYIKRVACLYRKLTLHDARTLSPDIIAHLYHGHVKAVEHGHACHEHAPGEACPAPGLVAGTVQEGDR